MLEASLHKSVWLIPSSLVLKPLDVTNSQIIRPDLKSLTSIDGIVSKLVAITFINNSEGLSQSPFLILLELGLAFAAVVNSMIR